ncbi:hypothetical protein PIECOFPK_00718 [Mycovorax composti]|jgi:hypothetical protein|uniref:DUF5606 domain-containing protein n=2 Tax=Chitinophagaceae TaxID=563835 RepID=A0ABZ2EHP3_9BACT
MEYNKLVAVTGLPGLYELISSKQDGAIVRSLQDKTTKFASARIHQFSHLESIEIYTKGENVNLVEVFNAMEKDGSPLPDVKDAKALRAYFEKVYPDMDFDRVYNSDMKKIVKWFDILKSNNVEIKLTQLDESAEEPQEEASQAAAAETKAAEEPVKEKKKAAPKKAAAKKAAEASDADEKSAAPKKAPAKKKAAAKKKSE